MNIVFLTIVLAFAVTSLNTKKSINALISFALMMLTLGLYYIYLDEKLLALFQIFVYTGGIAVLMLFGITLIGISFPKSRQNAWSAVAVVLFFAGITTLFLHYNSQLVRHSVSVIEKRDLFAESYSDVVILFALIASSLLYGTIKMVKALKPKRDKNV